jgi:hypothetical protein
MTKFRFHRGGFIESMATEVPAHTFEDVERIVAPTLPRPEMAKLIKFSTYGDIDERNGWQTCYVELPGYGVLGMTDGMPIADNEAGEVDEG